MVTNWGIGSHAYVCVWWWFGGAGTTYVYFKMPIIILIIFNNKYKSVADEVFGLQARRLLELKSIRSSSSSSSYRNISILHTHRTALMPWHDRMVFHSPTMRLCISVPVMLLLLLLLLLSLLSVRSVYPSELI